MTRILGGDADELQPVPPACPENPPAVIQGIVPLNLTSEVNSTIPSINPNNLTTNLTSEVV